MIKDLKVSNKLKVVKSLFYFSEDNLCDNELYSLEEIKNNLSCFIKEGDVWEVVNLDRGIKLLCIEGSMKGDGNEGWFNLEDIVDKDCFEVI